MEPVDAPTHPQMFISGFEIEECESMARLVQHSAVVDELTEQSLRTSHRLEEWDVAVTRTGPVYLPSHMLVLSFGGPVAGIMVGAESRRTTTLSYEGSAVSRQLHVARDLPDKLRRLVSRLSEELRGLETRPYLMFQQSSGSYIHRTGATARDFPQATPWICDADQQIIAGSFGRPGKSTAWLLPIHADHPELWLDAALEAWHDLSPARVPQQPGWRQRAQWLTAAEREAASTKRSIQETMDAAVTDFRRRVAEADSAIVAATATADAGTRRLLTAQGNELVEAVIDVIRSLGFDVVDVDAHLAAGSLKTEDLRITDPHDPSWTNICEVKGYTGGGKSSDLVRFERYARHYRAEYGDDPITRWYVVNQFLNNDPDSRAPLLSGADADVEVFAELGGLAIDTRDLFALARQVEGGELVPAEARRRLRTSNGRFVL